MYTCSITLTGYTLFILRAQVCCDILTVRLILRWSHEDNCCAFDYKCMKYLSWHLFAACGFVMLWLTCNPRANTAIKDIYFAIHHCHILSVTADYKRSNWNWVRCAKSKSENSGNEFDWVGYMYIITANYDKPERWKMSEHLKQLFMKTLVYKEPWRSLPLI